MSQLEHHSESWPLTRSLAQSENDDRLPLVLCWAIWGGLSLCSWLVLFKLLFNA